MKQPDYWTSTSPWLHRLEGHLEELAGGGSEALTVVLDATQMTTVDGLFEAFRKGMDFPSYFGANWNAFDEMLESLDWMYHPAYLIVILNPSLLLIDESSKLGALFETLDEVSRYWSDAPGKGRVAFNTVLLSRPTPDA